MTHHIHTLVWNSHNINTVIRQGIENDVATFGETIIAKLNVVATFSDLGIV